MLATRGLAFSNRLSEIVTVRGPCLHHLLKNHICTLTGARLGFTWVRPRRFYSDGFTSRVGWCEPRLTAVKPQLPDMWHAGDSDESDDGSEPAYNEDGD